MSLPTCQTCSGTGFVGPYFCPECQAPWSSPEALDLRHAGTGRILNQDEEGREVRGYAVDE